MGLFDLLRRIWIGHAPSREAAARIASVNAELACFISLRDDEIYDLLVTGRWQRPSSS
jgi:hypothetical protein